MKNPNGYGSVFKLSGNRRKPWCARVTVGWTDDGKQEYKNIGYYEERADAMIALAQYNNDPYDLDANKITFAEVYQKWSEEKFPKISKSNVDGYAVSYNKCKMLHDLKFKQIRKMHMQRVINENDHLSYQVRVKLKTLFLQLYKFAMENDIIEKNYAQFIEPGELTTKIERKPFSDEEIETLWKNIDVPYVDSLLIMIYSGMRIGELLLIKPDDIDIEQRIVIGGIKTEAGKKRAIPINHKILPIIKSKMDQKYLILSTKGKKLSYKNYNENIFKPLMKQLAMTHMPHDCRHTAATLLDNVGANKTVVKKILGHKSSDVTERVYTHKTFEQLVETIDKI